MSEEFTVTSPFLETPDIETSSSDYATRFSGQVGEWFLRIQAEATLRMLEPYRGGSVLDVGGGHGQLTEPLLREGFEISVLGSAESCVKRIQHLVDGKRCSFRVGNILELPYPDKAFDVVISFRLLPHVNRSAKLLQELARVAGKAVLLDYPEVHSINYISPYLFKYKKNLEGNTRTYTCFREAEIKAQFNDRGFDLTDRFKEFFLPMVLHRKLNNVGLSSALEKASRFVGLTGLLGSPVILKFVRRGGINHENLNDSSTTFLH